MSNGVNMDHFVNFVPPGPEGAAFMDCRLFSKFIMGPVGSGKTSCMIVDTIKDAGRQLPSKVAFERVKGAKMPIRMSKALFVRETFRQLEGTTIPSWWQWIPKSVGHWSGGSNSVATHELKFAMPPCARYDAGTIVELMVIFDALGEHKVEALFKGKEFNLLRLNEADTLRSEIYAQGTVRVRQGRYPGERHVDPQLCVKNIAGDLNATDPDNWLWTLLTENKPENCGFFRQPGGLDPHAENRKRATEQDYRDMEADLIAQGRKDLARRNVHNLPGFSREGDPVYEDYNDNFHCAANDLEPVDGVPIKIYADAETHPAVLLMQTMANGQRRVLSEIHIRGGAKQLAEAIREEMARNGWLGKFRLVGGTVDPSAARMDAKDSDQEDWLMTLSRALDLPRQARLTKAPTNDPMKRIDAVNDLLTTLIDGGQPSLLISPRCKILRKGFNSSYCYKKRANGQAEDKPTKAHPVSDIHDAMQYLALDDGGYESQMVKVAKSKRWGQGKTFQAKTVVQI